MSAVAQRDTARPLNVLFLMIQMTGMGGSERLVLNLVRNLDRRRFAPSVGWFVGEAPLKEFVDLNVPLYYTPKVKAFDWRAMRAVSRIVSDARIDVINAHHFMSCVYAYYASRIANRARLVYTEHSRADVLSAQGKWQLAGRHIVSSCDAVIGISELVTQTLTTHFRLKPGFARTIENGVDVNLFGGSTVDRLQLREKLDLRRDDVVIALVANFRRNKNHMFLLKAFHALLHRRSHATLVFVGQGFADDPENSEPEVAAYVREHHLEDCVKLLGYQANVHDLLASIDISCLVSYKEGLPLSLVEAMASGLPVVATDIEGIRPIVRDGINGCLVQPDDVAGLTTVLERLIADPAVRLQLGAESRRIARDRYTLERCIRETEQVLAAEASYAA
jgi:glycosyltransferase involved in cell wall biosynthesis